MKHSKIARMKVYDVYTDSIKKWGIIFLVEVLIAFLFNPEWLVWSPIVTIFIILRNVVTTFIGPVVVMLEVWYDKYYIVQLLFYIFILIPVAGLLFSALRLLVWAIGFKMIEPIKESWRAKKTEHANRANLGVISRIINKITGFFGRHTAPQAVKLPEAVDSDIQAKLLSFRKKYAASDLPEDRGVYVRTLIEASNCNRDTIMHWENGMIEIPYPGDKKSLIVLKLRGGQAYLEALSQEDKSYNMIELNVGIPMEFCRPTAQGMIPAMRITWLGGNHND